MTAETPSSTSPAAAAVPPVGPPVLLRTLLLCATIFVGGAGTGFGLAVAFGPRPFPPPPQNSADLRPDPPIDRLVATMQEELALSPDQARQVTDIYTRRFAAIKKIRDTMSPEYAGLRTDIQKVLTADQFARWDKRYHEIASHMFPPPPRRGPPPPGYGPEGGPDGDGGRRPPPPPGAGPPPDGPDNGPPPN